MKNNVTNHILSKKKITYSWLWLILLTVLSAYNEDIFALFTLNKSLFIGCVLFIVFLKGQQIIDVFMELSQAPKLWRNLLLGYVTLLPIIIGLIYLLSFEFK